MSRGGPTRRGPRRRVTMASIAPGGNTWYLALDCGHVEHRPTRANPAYRYSMPRPPAFAYCASCHGASPT